MKNPGLLKTVLVIALVGCCSLVSAQSATYTFVHETVPRTYIVHLPPAYSTSVQHPLVINMHGYGTDGSLQESVFGMNDVADTANFIVVYPDGISVSWNAGQLWSYATGIDDVSFISDLIDTMAANFSIDTTMVYATGLSNGGFMSYRLACELDNKIAAIAPVAGVMSDSVRNTCQTDRPVPVMHFHGTTDGTIAYDGSGAGDQPVDSCIAYWVARNNITNPAIITSLPDIITSDNSTVDEHYYGLGDAGTEVVLLQIFGGGHNWPGGPDLSGFGYGNTNMDIDANSMMWLFFRRHTLSGTTPNPLAQQELTNKLELKIWPNPSSGTVFISGELTADLKISIVNLLGQEILTENATQAGNDKFSLDVSGLQSGMYLIKIVSSEQTITEVFVKQ